ncbi:hypothetical protein C2G38_2030222 [Gigaspora rosea]|uniref:Uncharacterized protein n=1 Tax=Gigaspora rosea TaxID=44941 RepID=A0A397W2C8_9GLOM|nr:hypothetical protein C2G38_2030222 [Gigaspora rosea]
MEFINIPEILDEPTNCAATTIDILKIDSNTKPYIDAACQNSANMIINSIKAYIDQHAATQSATIDKLNKSIDQRFEQLQLQNPQQRPSNLQNTTQQEQHNHDLKANLNNNRAFISNKKQFTATLFKQPHPQKRNMLITAVYPNKYPLFEYNGNDLPLVTGFSNYYATNVESIRLWWILNWSEGQKALEMLLTKPNLPHVFGKQLQLEATSISSSLVTKI